MADPDRAERTEVCDCPEYRYDVCPVCKCVTGVRVAGAPDGQPNRAAEARAWILRAVPERYRDDAQAAMADLVADLQARLNHHHFTTEPGWDPSQCPSCQHADQGFAPGAGLLRQEES